MSNITGTKGAWPPPKDGIDYDNETQEAIDMYKAAMQGPLNKNPLYQNRKKGGNRKRRRTKTSNKKKRTRKIKTQKHKYRHNSRKICKKRRTKAR